YARLGRARHAGAPDRLGRRTHFRERGHAPAPDPLARLRGAGLDPAVAGPGLHGGARRRAEAVPLPGPARPALARLRGDGGGGGAAALRVRRLHYPLIAARARPGATPSAGARLWRPSRLLAGSLDLHASGQSRRPWA